MQEWAVVEGSRYSFDVSVFFCIICGQVSIPFRLQDFFKEMSLQRLLKCIQ